ncbi:hypothetical protein UlMin_001582 [Ulmus minor]
MSWQTYVDDHLMCNIDEHNMINCILLYNFPTKTTDIMNDFEELGHLASIGLHLGGTKYMRSGGVTVKKIVQALVFNICEEPVTPGQCNMVVERLGDYLIEQGACRGVLCLS